MGATPLFEFSFSVICTVEQRMEEGIEFWPADDPVMTRPFFDHRVATLTFKME